MSLPLQILQSGEWPKTIWCQHLCIIIPAFVKYYICVSFVCLGRSPFFVFVLLQGFKQQAHTLKHEKRIHEGINPLQCQVHTFPVTPGWLWMFHVSSDWLGLLQKCSAILPNFEKLTVHGVNMHGDAKPHTCNFCGEQFAAKTSFQRHLKTHGVEKPFS